MNRVSIIIALLLLSPTSHSASIRLAAQKPLRVALVGLASKPTDEARRVERVLGEALSRDARVTLLDQSMVLPAVKGIGYDGSINLSEEEARRLGAAIGCDFFIIGKAEALDRSRRENESHLEAYAAVMIVDARSGALAVFDFVSEQADTKERALTALANDLNSRAAGYIDRLAQERIRAATLAPASTEPAEDIPDEGSPRAAGFATPVFLNRVKPDYTREAEQADVTASVEAMVVFKSNAQVGEIHIVRWAGFGLDESAARAIRQLKFKPATRDGKPINVRALIRYNFRRVTEREATPNRR